MAKMTELFEEIDLEPYTNFDTEAKAKNRINSLISQLNFDSNYTVNLDGIDEQQGGKNTAKRFKFTISYKLSDKDTKKRAIKLNKVKYIEK